MRSMRLAPSSASSRKVIDLRFELRECLFTIAFHRIERFVRIAERFLERFYGYVGFHRLLLDISALLLEHDRSRADQIVGGLVDAV